LGGGEITIDRKLFIKIVQGAFLCLLGGAIIGWFAAEHWSDGPFSGSTEASSPQASAALIQQFKCDPGLTKIVVMHGLDDNFASGSEEPAAVRPALQEVERYRELAEGRHGVFGRRGYDEGGADKFLIDHFELPRGIVSGQILTRLKLLPGSDTDSVTVGNFDPAAGLRNFRGEIEYLLDELAPAARRFPPDENGIVRIELERLQHDGSRVNGPPELIDYLNQTSRPDSIDLIVQDDTLVDFFAFLLCQEPAEAMGTRMFETTSGIGAIGMSYLSCAEDPTQPSCNPFRGDRLCRVPTPIACYRDGDRKLPPTPDREAKYASLDDGFVGGEVRLSPPVKAERFGTLGDANKFCAAEFGPRWRVLSFHEATGAKALSFSKIEPRAFGLVQVGDNPYANCWDRPASVVRP